MRIFTEQALQEYADSNPDVKVALQEWAVKRVEELLPLVDDSTPLNNPNSIELELLSNLVADYSEEHFALGKLSLADVCSNFVCLRWGLIKNHYLN